MPLQKKNKKMRKQTIAAALSVLCLCFLLAACGGQELTDGVYQIDVTLKGGSGRAQIESAAVEIRNGSAVSAEIQWSSPFYDFMIIDGVRYEPIQQSGNARFQIPVVLDQAMKVSADTVAMSQPHLIEYQLIFDSRTLRKE